jgi:hypothetical protein
MKALIVSIILLASCAKEAKISTDSFGLRVSDVHMDITQLNEIDWWIGAKRKEDKVTQSISFSIDMPLLPQKELDRLSNERQVDSWLVRVIQVKGSSGQDLGSFMTPFKYQKRSRSSNSGPNSSAAVKIYYAAAYASERLRSFKCPAFSHDKRIGSMAVKGKDASFEIAFGQSFPYQEKVQLVQMTPSSFNGGHTLTGQFHFEIAPYDSIGKRLMGTFKRIPRFVEVENEKFVNVPSCQGAHQELQ